MFWERHSNESFRGRHGYEWFEKSKAMNRLQEHGNE